MHQCSLMSLSTAASTATVAKRATANDDDPDDGNRNNVVILHNTVILNHIMEDLQSDIEEQLKYWGKKKGEGNADWTNMHFTHCLTISDTVDVGMDCSMDYWLVSNAPRHLRCHHCYHRGWTFRCRWVAAGVVAIGSLCYTTFATCSCQNHTIYC